MTLVQGVITFLVTIDIIFVIFFLVTARPTFKQFLIWAVIIMALPVLGFAICINIGPVNYSKCFLSEKEIMGDDAERHIREVSDNIESENRPGNEDNYALIKAISEYSDISFSVNNDVEIFEMCEDYYDHLQRDMEGAMEYIHIEVYIVEGDFLTQRFMDTLYKKLDEGVKVRFLCDDVGLSANTHQMILDFIDRGGEFSTFNPLINHIFSAKKSNRLHKKAIIIDGKCSYTGGINFSIDYLGLSKHGKWKDLGLRMTGDIVHQMDIWFAIDWNYASKKTIPREHLLRADHDPGGNLRLQHISSGMYRPDDTSEVQIGLLLRSAKRTIQIQTPYLVPTRKIMRDLTDAAESGVEIFVMIPAHTDFNMAGYNNELSAYKLLKHGVKVYRYTGAFLHTKRIIIDGKNCVLGSTNLDILSLKRAFETNVIVYSEVLSAKMEEAFSKDLESCDAYTCESHRKRSLAHRAMGVFALLFRPFI